MSEKKSDEDEIGFDLKKIKFFSRKKKKDEPAEEEPRDEGMPSVDIKTIGKYAKKYSLVLFILVPIIFSIFLRIQPAYLPATDSWAQNSIQNSIKANIRQSLDAQYPNLPDANKEKIVNEEFKKVWDAGTLNMGGQQLPIEQVIEQNSQYFKEKFQTEDEHTYLLAIDPYYYYRLTRNLVETGSQWDYLDENGRYHDSKVMAGKPLGEGGTDKVGNLHVHLQYFLFKFVRLFKQDIDLMTVVFYTPLIIGTLAVIPAFFIARKVGGNIGGFFAGMLVALHPAFLTRTAGGFSDTDAYNVFFPLIIIWLLIEAFSTKSQTKAIILAALSGLSMGLFSYAWGGWFFIFNFAIAMAAVAVGYAVIMDWTRLKKDPAKILQNPELKTILITSGLFFLSSAIFVSLMKSFSVFSQFIKSTISFTQLKEVGTLKVWPNVYTTVAELNPASLATTINQISLGSKLWLFFGFLGIILPLLSIRKENKNRLYFVVASAIWFLGLILLQKSFKSHVFFAILISVPVIIWTILSIINKEKIDIKYSIIITLWFVGTIYASSKGVRFILLLVPAFAVAAGISIGIISRTLSDWLSKELKINALLTQTVIFALFFLLLFYPTNFVKAATNTSKNEIPSMNDDWYNTLTKIRDESEPDAIINSWWDFGHWFSAIGERAVTLDGGRQNNPQAHWLGKLMLTWNETESVGILRYLDCGANTGFDTLLEYMQNDSLRAINSVYEIIVVDRERGREILQEKGLNDEQIEDVLQYTHCKPPENYFITSEDMVGKSGVWAHFGSWDFDKAVMYNKVHDKDQTTGVQILETEFGKNDSEAYRLYNEIQAANPDQWISPWPSYAGGLSGCSVSGATVTCRNGVVFDMEEEVASVATQAGTQYFASFTYVDGNGNFRVKTHDKDILRAQNGRPLGAALIPQGNGYRSVLMDSDLTASMFTRLFYYEGYGLRYFKEFNKVTDVTGAKIITWKIDWEGKEMNLPEPVAEPEQEQVENATEEEEEVEMEETDDDEPSIEETEPASDFDLARIEHILIDTADRSEEEAEELADTVYTMINETNFEELVGVYSECSDNTTRCTLSWFGKGVLEQAFDDVVFELQVDQVSPPFKTSNGYEIVKLVDTK